MKGKSNNIIYALLMALNDIVKEIKNLRTQKSKLSDQDINLAISGVVICPNCGATFEAKSSKCNYCGYISKERDEKLEIIRRQKRSIDLQIQENQGQIKKILMIPLIIGIPLMLAIMVMLSISFFGFFLTTFGPKIVELLKNIR